MNPTAITHDNSIPPSAFADFSSPRAEVREASYNGLSLYYAAVLVAGLAFIAMTPLSVGPVFAYTCNHPSSVPSFLCRYYRPLFRIAPELTTQYLLCWGVSDIEAYFLLEPVQQGIPTR